MVSLARSYQRKIWMKKSMQSQRKLPPQASLLLPWGKRVSTPKSQRPETRLMCKYPCTVTVSLSSCDQFIRRDKKITFLKSHV